MYSKRSFIKKSYFVVLFIIALLSFSVGYSYLNSSLFINGTSVISANVWDISLDNLNISDGSVVAESQRLRRCHPHLSQRRTGHSTGLHRVHRRR